MRPVMIKGITIRKIKRILLFIFISVAVVTIILFLILFMYRDLFRYPSKWKNKIYKPFSEGTRPNVINLEIYDLSSPTQQMGFQCFDTKTQPHITACIYPEEIDTYISHDIRNTGVWEPDITDLLIEALESDKHGVFLDIGSNIGYFSLIAAHIGHPVVAVEPDLDHIFRFHQSIGIERSHDKIIILRNAVADKRDAGTVRKSGHNQGDSQIEIGVKECRGHCPPTVKVIVLNDLTDLIYDLTLISTNPERELKGPSLYRRVLNFRNFRDAHFQEKPPIEITKFFKQTPANVIIKVDTQGFEHKIFDNPDFFFDRNSVSLIFMEWGTMARSHSLFNKTVEPPFDKTFLGQKDLGPEDAMNVEIMIRFLSERGFRPYSTTRPRLGEALNPLEWNLWPHDIVWCHDSQTMFMFKMGAKNLFG